MADTSLTGRLLVAAPTLRDPNFFRTVLLVLAHGDEGAAAVVLNRPSDTPVERIVPELEPITADPPVVFAGGPVATDAALCLGLAGTPEPAPGWQPLYGPIGVVDLEHVGGGGAEDVHSARLFAGYAGWGAQQLEGEIEMGAWYVVTAAPEDAFSPTPERLWRSVLRRQGATLAMVANFPADPGLN